MPEPPKPSDVDVEVVHIVWTPQERAAMSKLALDMAVQLIHNTKTPHDALAVCHIITQSIERYLNIDSSTILDEPPIPMPKGVPKC